METVAFFIMIGCLASPFLFAIIIGLGILYWKDRERAQLEQKKLQKLLQALSVDAQSGLRLQWFEEIKLIGYKNEIEVEIKFVYPLLRLLGYGANDLSVRVLMGIPVGRQKASGVADWVAYRERDRPFLVVEAKERNQSLNEAVRQQARSYSYGLNTPYYMVTNGNDLLLYVRRVDEDKCVLSCKVGELENRWDELEKIVGFKTK